MWHLDEVFEELTVLAIPMRTKFRGLTTREVALFRGPQGWSEFGPFVEYSDLESAPWLNAGLDGAYNPWSDLQRSQVSINATLPRVKISEVKRILQGYPGAKSVKIKISDFDIDNDLVDAALEFNPDFKVRLDINGSWDLTTALRNLYNYHLRFGNVFEYIEQPVLEVSDLMKLKAEIPMKIAIDESIRKALDSDFEGVSNWADYAIIKWAPVGGATEARKLISKIGLPAIISSALDTGIGISHGLALAGSLLTGNLATGNLDCGLATFTLFEADVVSPRLEIFDGQIAVERTEPDGKLLKKYLATPERKIWWQERITRIWESGLGERWSNEQRN